MYQSAFIGEIIPFHFFYSVEQGASLFAWFVRAHHTREHMVGALTIYSLCLFDLQIAHFETQYGKISSKPANSPKSPIQPQTHNPPFVFGPNYAFSM